MGKSGIQSLFTKDHYVDSNEIVWADYTNFILSKPNDLLNPLDTIVYKGEHLDLVKIERSTMQYILGDIIDLKGKRSFFKVAVGQVQNIGEHGRMVKKPVWRWILIITMICSCI